MIIAKASAKAAQVSVAHMAHLQDQQDEELRQEIEKKVLDAQQQQPQEDEEQKRVTSLEDQTRSSGSSSDILCRNISERNKSTPFRPVSYSMKDHSVSVTDKVASQGREMDSLVQSMSARHTASTSFMGSELGK